MQNMSKIKIEFFRVEGPPWEVLFIHIYIYSYMSVYGPMIEPVCNLILPSTLCLICWWLFSMIDRLGISARAVPSTDFFKPFQLAGQLTAYSLAVLIIIAGYEAHIGDQFSHSRWKTQTTKYQRIIGRQPGRAVAGRGLVVAEADLGIV